MYSKNLKSVLKVLIQKIILKYSIEKIEYKHNMKTKINKIEFFIN